MMLRRPLESAYPESINVRPAPPAGRGEKPSLEA